MDRRIDTLNGTEIALARLKEARCRLIFLQQALVALDNGDGLLDGAAVVADDVSIAVLDAEEALEAEQAKQACAGAE